MVGKFKGKTHLRSLTSHKGPSSTGNPPLAIAQSNPATQSMQDMEGYSPSLVPMGGQRNVGRKQPSASGKGQKMKNDYNTTIDHSEAHQEDSLNNHQSSDLEGKFLS